MTDGGCSYLEYPMRAARRLRPSHRHANLRLTIHSALQHLRNHLHSLRNVRATRTSHKLSVLHLLLLFGRLMGKPQRRAKIFQSLHHRFRICLFHRLTTSLLRHLGILARWRTSHNHNHDYEIQHRLNPDRNPHPNVPLPFDRSHPQPHRDKRVNNPYDSSDRARLKIHLHLHRYGSKRSLRQLPPWIQLRWMEIRGDQNRCDRFRRRRKRRLGRGRGRGRGRRRSGKGVDASSCE